jgi:hypothetical protein
MTRPTPRRKAAAGVALTLVTFSLGVTVAMLVAGSAAAVSPPGTSSTTYDSSDPNAPGAQFLAINATVNAASDHEIVGSSAFPNYTTGAVDNYYTMSRSHVDNSPFAEGTASPADTGPIGQTAAAGNFQQQQYADARWPGGPDKASFGSQGGPFAEAAADLYLATADASEPSHALNGPAFKLPIGFDLRLQELLDAWKAKWLGPLTGKTPTAPVTPPKVAPPVTTPGITVPKPAITTPLGTVSAPSTSSASPAPTAPSQSPLPTVTTPPRSLSSTSASGDGESLLTSSSDARLVPDPDHKATATTTKTGTTKGAPAPKQPTKFYKLVTSGESSLGRVSLGGGQIVIEGIHVTASITNDGTPAYKAAVSVASASIGGIPVTIDQDGVHIAGHSQALPYKQASDSLNNALKQAGIQLFLVGPEVTSCNQGGSGTGTGTTGTDTTSTTTTTSTDQSSTTSTCGQSAGMCDQSGTGSGTGYSPTTTGATTTTSTTPSSSPSGSTGTSPCGQTSSTSSCDQAGTGTNGSTNTTTTSAGPGGVPSIGTPTTGTTTTTQSGTSTMPSSCGQSGTFPATGSCSKSGSTNSSPPSASPSSTTSSGGSNPFDFTSPNAGGMNQNEMTVTATGVHLIFTQPTSPPGAPSQSVEHILGEVYVDSLATPQGPVGPLPDLGFSTSSSSSSSSSSSCLGGGHASGASASGGSSSVAGGSGALGSSGSAFGSGAQAASGSGTGSGSTANSVPAAFAAALKKPLWLLLAYVVWQAMVIGTGVSLWNWRRGGAT